MTEPEFNVYARALLFLGGKMCEHGRAEAVRMVAVRADGEDSEDSEDRKEVS